MSGGEMGIINLEDIRPGMILGCDLKDRGGRVLLSAAIEITEKHLRIFKMWGITEADIQGVEKEEIISKATEEIDPALLHGAEAQAGHFFLHTDRQHPFMHELFRLVTLRMVLPKSIGKDRDA
jgi:hypothetical protein